MKHRHEVYANAAEIVANAFSDDAEVIAGMLYAAADEKRQDCTWCAWSLEYIASTYSDRLQAVHS